MIVALFGRPSYPLAMTIRHRLAKYAEDCRTLPADAMLAYRLEGLNGAWDTLRQRTLDRILYTAHLVVFAQLLDSAPEVPPPPGVVIKRLQESDWPAMATSFTQRNLTRFHALATAGRQAVIAWRGSKPIGYGWVAASLGPDVTSCPLELPPEAAYLWDLYVIPAERSNGVGSALASARIRIARECGFREGWRMISPTNAASLKTLPKSGAPTRVVGELRLIKILNRVYARFTPATIPLTGLN
jgi:GNAT superfamily N-acetyltransferase